MIPEPKEISKSFTARGLVGRLVSDKPIITERVVREGRAREFELSTDKIPDPIKEIKVSKRGRVVESSITTFGGRLVSDIRPSPELKGIEGIIGRGEGLQSRLEIASIRETSISKSAGLAAGVFGLGFALGVGRTFIGFGKAIIDPLGFGRGIIGFAKDPTRVLGRIGPALAVSPVAVGGEIAGTIAASFIPGAIIGRIARARAASIIPEAVGVKSKTTRIVTTSPEGLALTQDTTKLVGSVVGKGLFGRQKVVKIAGTGKEIGVPTLSPTLVKITRIRGTQDIVARGKRGPTFIAERVVEGVSRPTGRGVATTRLVGGVTRKEGVARGIGSTTIESIITKPAKKDIISSVGTVTEIGTPVRGVTKPPSLTRQSLAQILSRADRPSLLVTGRATRIRREFLFETPAGITESEVFKSVSFAVKPIPRKGPRVKTVRTRRTLPVPRRQDLRDLLASSRPARPISFPPRPITIFQQPVVTKIKKRRRGVPTGIETSLGTEAIRLGKTVFAGEIAGQVKQLSEVGRFGGIFAAVGSPFAKPKGKRPLQPPVFDEAGQVSPTPQVFQRVFGEQALRPATTPIVAQRLRDGQISSVATAVAQRQRVIALTRQVSRQVSRTGQRSRLGIRQVTSVVPKTSVTLRLLTTPIVRPVQAVATRQRLVSRARQVTTPRVALSTITTTLPVIVPGGGFTVVPPLSFGDVTPIVPRSKRKKKGLFPVTAFTPSFTALGLGIVGRPEKLKGFKGFGPRGGIEVRKIIPERLRARFEV